MYTEYRKYPLSGSFIYKSIWRHFSQLQISLWGEGSYSIHCSRIFVVTKISKLYNISTGSLLFRTLIFWCFTAKGTELQTQWLARFEPRCGQRETKNSWIPQPSHRFRSCRIQVGDLNYICIYIHRLRWSRCIVLAFSTQFCGFKPGFLGR